MSPVRRPGAVDRPPAPSPLEDLNTRVTYRTMRVLRTIATRPGLTNGEIATQAGVCDQGQISKLLGRLARLGLIENTGNTQSKTLPNAWRLTLRGRQLERAIARDVAPTRPPHGSAA